MPPEDIPFVESFWCMNCDEHVTQEKLCQSFMRLKLKRHMLLDLDLTVQEICDIIEDALDHDVICYGADDNAQELVIHVRFEREEIGPNDLSEHAFVQDISRTLLDAVSINGIPEIDTLSVQKRNVSFLRDDGGIDTRDEFYIETLGINMKAVICKVGVDRSRLYCNDPKEMLNTYGIEAARQCLLKEIRKVIEGSYVNYRHVSLLCDLMTNRGQIMSVTRHGVNRLATGPIKKSTFEETLEVLMEAALSCEVDPLQGCSENIMLGRPIRCGTGAVSIYYDDS
jgi:DNA-directed RNA polymerase II subunit RPB1